MSSNVSYPWFYFFRIARLSILIFLPTLILILYFYRTTHKESLIQHMSTETEESLRTLKLTIDKYGANYSGWCKSLPVQVERYSLVTKEGFIVCDTHKGGGESIQDMSEVNQSFAREFFSSVRRSDLYHSDALFASLRITPDLALRKVIPIAILKEDMGKFDRILLFRILPFALLSYLIFMYFFYESTKPLGAILGKVEKFKADLPFDKTLELLYEKDRWAQIEEALNKADVMIRDREILARIENEKVAAILESISDDIIAVDPFETILFYNNNFRRDFMRERSHEILPKLWHSFNDERVLDAFRSVLKTGEKTYLRGIQHLSGKKSERFYDLTITSLRNPDGKISGALGVFYDVTEFKLTEQMRVDFVANVSHEIRTPLTSVKGYSQVLQGQREKIHPDLQPFLEKIVANTERMIALFNDLLNLSVIESQNQLKSEEFSLVQVAETVVENIRTNYPDRPIRTELDLQLETIRGDARLIEQVLTNLVDNARKYSSEDLLVRITSFARDGVAVIRVEDNGPGIPKEHLQRIFERFYRVESSRESIRGTGLGLSIVKHIIAKHGGKIWAESGTRGSTFVIELPLK